MGILSRVYQYVLLLSFLALISCGGSGGGDSESDDQAPNQPSNLTAIGTSESSIDLGWVDESDDEALFRIERSPSAANTFVAIATPGANSTEYTDSSGLTAGTAYDYRVIAVNTEGESAPSAIATASTQAAASAPPAAPDTLAATATSSSSIGLTWVDNSDNESGFIVGLRESGGGLFQLVGTPGTNITDYSVTGLTADTAYDFQVRATNSAGDSAPSAIASATTLPPAATVPTTPSNLSAIAASSTSIELTWMDNADNETGFRIERDSGAGFVPIAPVAADTSSYTDSFGLLPSTQYFYRIFATNGAGDSDPSATVSETTLAPPILNPLPPTSISATAISSTEIDLSWTVDAASEQTSFNIERSLVSNSGFVQVGNVAGGLRAFSDSGLSASTNYYYRVEAINATGSSGYSDVANAVTQVGIPNVPILTLISNVSGDITLEWTYNWGGIFGSSNDGYSLEQSTTSPSSGFSVIFNTTFTGDRESPKTFVASSRPAGNYYYRVRAFDGGFTGYSNVLAVTVANTIVTNTYPISADNLINTSSQDASAANTAFPTSENAIGCNWIYSTFTGIQDYTCFSSLLYFNVDADITGKTIIDARLKIYPEILPASFTQYKLWAIFENWLANVTWNTQPLVVGGSSRIFDQPVTTVIPQEIAVTDIVQNWADGSWANYGFLLEDNNIFFPFATELRATGYCSGEGVPSCARPPELEITYQ